MSLLLRTTALSCACILSVGSTATTLEAQAVGQITGVVSDAVSGAPVRDVQIYLAGSSTGTLSRQNGRYLIVNVPAGTHELRAERIGMTSISQQITVIAGSTVEANFAMTTQTLGLDELVVTGTAGAARRREIGNSISQINAVDLPDRPTNVANMLQSVAPGAELTLGGGETGQGSRIRLRGANSISMDSDPIIYIDGVRIMSSLFPPHFSPDLRSSRGSGITPSPLEQINPNDIERIEIIKGSAATTLYGTEASGGVIQIFTKRGSSASTSWTAEIQQGTQWSRPFGTNGIDYLWMDPWICTGFLECGDRTHTARSQMYSTSVRGGRPDLQYFASGQFDKEDGQLPNDFLERWSVRGNFSFTPMQSLQIQWTNNYSQTWQMNTPMGGNSHGLPINVFRQAQNYYGTGDPDVMDRLLEWDLQSTLRRYTTGGTFSYSGVPNMGNRLTIGYDYSTQDNRSIRPFGFIALPDGAIDVYNYLRNILTFDYVGNYSFGILPSLKTNFSWGGQAAGDETATLEGWGVGFPGAVAPTVSSATTTQAFESRSKIWNAGFFLQNVFDVEDRYFLTFGMRVDGNSAFGKSFGLQMYPKASATWVISEEPWIPAIGSLKLRAAYGQSGKAPGSFDAVRTWANSSLKGQAAFVPQNVGNPDLGPEVTAEFETGFDGAWMEDRIRSSFTYYRQLTTDALLAVSPLPSMGFTNPQLTNVGELKNSGMEISLDVSPIRRTDWGLDMGVNFSTNNSEVLTWSTPNSVRIGRPLVYTLSTIVLNPDEIAAPILERQAYTGPALPTKIINGHTTLRLPYAITLSTRGEFKGGHSGRVEPVDIGRSVRSPICFPYYANETNVALKPDLPAIWRARCTPGINAGYTFKRDHFTLTSVSATMPVPTAGFLPDQLQNSTLMLALDNPYRRLVEIPHYDADLGNYRLPVPITFRGSLRITF